MFGNSMAVGSLAFVYFLVGRELYRVGKLGPKYWLISSKTSEKIILGARVVLTLFWTWVLLFMFLYVAPWEKYWKADQSSFAFPMVVFIWGVAMITSLGFGYTKGLKLKEIEAKKKARKNERE